MFYFLQDDELGNLDDGEKVAVARGAADISHFSSVLEQFMDEHKVKPVL